MQAEGPRRNVPRLKTVLWLIPTRVAMDIFAGQLGGHPSLTMTLQGQRHDPLNVSIGDSAGSARPCFIHQSVQSTLQEPRPPLANRRLRHSQLCGHSGVRLALRTFQDHSGPLGQRLRRLGPARPLSQCLPFIVGERQRWGWSTKTHVNPPHMNCQEDTSYQTLMPLTSETRH